MQITQLESDHVLRITGDVDMNGLESLRRALAASLDRDSVTEIDLSGVEACDAAALQLLVAARKSACRFQKAFRIVALSPAMVETLSALGLEAEPLTLDMRS
jgi:anti-anti-sigma factor